VRGVVPALVLDDRIHRRHLHSAHLPPPRCSTVAPGLERRRL